MKKYRIVSLTLVALLVSVIGAVPAYAAEINVPADYLTIQEAINAASSGDTIYVAAGTYDEALTIDGKDLTLIAVGAAKLAPTSCTSHNDAVTITNGVVVFDGFEVDAGGCGGGLYARGGCAGDGPVDVTFKNNYVHDFYKNGITVNCSQAAGAVTDNKVVGSEPSEDVAQNGIQFGYGAVGTVMHNEVESHWYTGADWTASGILVFESDEVTVQNNSVKNCQTGIGVEAWCWLGGPSASYNRIVKNTLTDTEWGISVSAVDLEGYSTCPPFANNNKVANNVLTNASNDGFVGIYVGAYSYPSPIYPPAADNNKVIHNTISGFEYEFYDEGTFTKEHAGVYGP